MLDEEEINVVSQRREGDLLHQGFEAFWTGKFGSICKGKVVVPS